MLFNLKTNSHIILLSCRAGHIPPLPEVRVLHVFYPITIYYQFQRRYSHSSCLTLNIVSDVCILGNLITINKQKKRNREAEKEQFFNYKSE